MDVCSCHGGSPEFVAHVWECVGVGGNAPCILSTIDFSLFHRFITPLIEILMHLGLIWMCGKFWGSGEGEHIAFPVGNSQFSLHLFGCSLIEKIGEHLVSFLLLLGKAKIR